MQGLRFETIRFSIEGLSAQTLGRKKNLAALGKGIQIQHGMIIGCKVRKCTKTHVIEVIFSCSV